MVYRSPTGNPRRKSSKRCTLTGYHISTVLLCIGIIILICGLATTRLFQIYIYDHRNPSKFHHLFIPVGLFSLSTHVTWLSMEHTVLSENLEINDFRWILARGLTLIGLFTAIIACIIHVIIAYFHVDHNWSTILTEAMFVLMSVTCILIGLCLAEMEIEHIHDHGDLALTNVLISNGLLQRTDNKYPNRSGLYSSNNSNNNNNNNNYQSMLADTGGGGGISDTTVVNSNNNNKNDHGSSRSSSWSTDTADRFDLSSDFAVLLTPPMSSFYLLISADFINLISFLLVFNYFIRQCEKARMDKRHMKSAETTTTSTTPTTRSHA